jgi:ABC-type Fe3+-hydroxamate transport system substrate-binding protein
LGIGGYVAVPLYTATIVDAMGSDNNDAVLTELGEVKAQNEKLKEILEAMFQKIKELENRSNGENP